MARRSPLLDTLLPRLAPLGEPRSRPMFGGWGIYIDDVFMGLIAGDTLYFKVDDGNRADYEAAGARPFTFTSRGQRVETSYWNVPPRVFADPDLLQQWATRAMAAAQRKRAAKAGSRRPRRKATSG